MASPAVAPPRRSESAGSQRPADGAARPDAEFRALYEEWFEEVSRWIRALGGPQADCDDIVQEVFLVVRRRLRDFDGANPAGWLYRIAQRQVKDFRRRVWLKHIFTGRRLPEPESLAHEGADPAAALEQKESERILYGILARIPEERRVAFVLFEIEGLSGDEIARIQGVPTNTVWTRLHSARRDFLAHAARYEKKLGRELRLGRS